MSQEDIVNEIEEQKENKPINKTILIVIIIIGAIIAISYFKDSPFGLIVFGIIALLVILLSGKGSNVREQLTLEEALYILKEHLRNNWITTQNLYNVKFPKGTTFKDLKWGGVDRFIDKLTGDALEWHFGFSIYKDYRHHYYHAKVDYWRKGVGVCGIIFRGYNREDEFSGCDYYRIERIPVSGEKLIEMNKDSNTGRFL